MWDVIIIGAGPAGLSAALILGRCRRHVLVCDSRQPRNAVAHEMHGFLSRDGIAPATFLQIGREQLGRYPNVRLLEVLVKDADRTTDGFSVILADGRRECSRKLLLATGLVDELPPIPGIEQYYGRSVFHCPYCDGWEVRDQPIAVYGHGTAGYRMALELTIWTKDLVLCTDSIGELSAEQRQRLASKHVVLCEQSIRGLVGNKEGQLEQILLANATALARTALFFSTGQHQRSHLPAKFGCRLTREGETQTDSREATHVPGLFITGDASTELRLAIGAAAKGAEAAFQINEELLQESLA